MGAQARFVQCLNPEPSRPARCTTMGAKHAKPGDAKKLLGTIDHDAKKCEKACEDLFGAFDKDKSGSLKGAELEGLKAKVVEYAEAEFKARGADKDYNHAQITEWVGAWLDPNQDGTCTKQEMHDGVKFIVDFGE